MLEDPVIEYELITKKLNITRSVVKALEEQNVAVLESEQVFSQSSKENCTKVRRYYVRQSRSVPLSISGKSIDRTYGHLTCCMG